MRRFVRYAAIAVAVLLVAVLVTGTITVRRPFPDTSGEVLVAGLRSDVEVVRDDHGIPRIYADNAEDLFYAQGFVHAQDRFFEMDFRRHVTAGRLAELVGPAGLDTDKYVRTLGWRRIAEEEVAALDSQTRAWLQAYADGVNAYIEGKSASALSLEYTVLSLSGPAYTPEPWVPADSVAWVKAMAWDLRSNMSDEIERSLLSEHLSDERIAELFPPFPYEERDPIVVEQTPGAAGTGASPALDVAAVRSALGALESVAAVSDRVTALLGTGEGLGSNSWVVSGEHTASGKPLLANDPHLAPSVPGIWHQIGLHCTERNRACPFDVSGFTFTGIPGVVVGHNDRIAWGVTTMYADVTDLYLERIDADSYEYDGERLPLDKREETFEIAGADPVTITVRSTRHGPLLSDLDPELRDAGTLRGGEAGPYAVSLRWTALEPQQTIRAVFALGTARDFEEFRAAAAQFTVPSQNLVYADVDGNIGYQAPGLIPVRRSGDGTWPVPGWDPAYDWEGYLDFEDLPSVYNPPSGVIVTANHPVTGPDHPDLIGHPGAYGYRSERIAELLAGRDDLDVEAMVQIQGDAENGFARTLVPRLLDYRLGSDYYEDGLRLLGDWDFQQTEDSAAAAYFNEFWRQLLQRTFADEIGVTPSGGERWMEVVRLLFDDEDHPFWDDVSTPVRETRDEVVVASLREARDELTRRQGRVADNWRWGDLHRLTLRHQPLGSAGIGLVERLFNRGPHPVAGGTGIVNANSWDAAEGFEVTAVPSMRMVVDLADFDRSRWIQLTGNSGHVFHRHHMDQFELWREGRTLPWPFTRAAVERAASRTMTLTSSS